MCTPPCYCAQPTVLHSRRQPALVQELGCMNEAVLIAPSPPQQPRVYQNTKPFIESDDQTRESTSHCTFPKDRYNDVSWRSNPSSPCLSLSARLFTTLSASRSTQAEDCATDPLHFYTLPSILTSYACDAHSDPGLPLHVLQMLSADLFLGDKRTKTLDSRVQRER